jgi:hypothetical protein
MSADQRFQQALEVIAALQGQINELNLRVSYQERAASPVVQQLPQPIVNIQVPHMHSMITLRIMASSLTGTAHTWYSQWIV